MFKDIFGTLLVLTGILDAIKYSLQAYKIHQAKSSRSISRKFINFALLNDYVKLGYGVCIGDMFIILSSILALICMMHLFFEIYWWYPYKCRGLCNFKRPNIFVYIINSWLPNYLRKKL